ncbi:MAG: DUF58 domain-containing protein [Acidimicrobiales bacterium]|nr:DUF58 domain-containing protein [Acidimicrobiales bacterium]MCB9373599.1 DUF58 domain-containing protein [Microthrixaceae bacterium]
MLTRTGWLTAAGAVALLAVGRLLALDEAFVAGATLGVLVLLAAVGVGLRRLHLDVARELHPRRVHAGRSSTIELEVRNRGRRRTPVLTLVDQVSGTRGARLAVAPLEREAVTGASYELPTERRGLLRVGPLEVLVGDPFGLAQARVRVTGVSELTVYPAIDDVAPIPDSSGTDPHAGRDPRHRLSPAGEEFFALREYVVGDDLRHVHWASTARRDRLMVRQDELPWQGRATVFLDLRAGYRPPESIEPAVRAAASLVHAGRRRGQQLRLVTSDGTDSGFAGSHAQVDAIMERLALVTAAATHDLGRAVDRLSRHPGGTLVLLLPADAAPDDRRRLQRLGSRYGRVVPVLFNPSSWDPDAGDGAARGDDGPRVTATAPFPVVWERLTRRPAPVGAP